MGFEDIAAGLDGGDEALGEAAGLDRGDEVRNQPVPGIGRTRLWILRSAMTST